ncbi:helix-turn-helix transcriptional regulator [Mesorhizobium sp. KR1-2]|uniref:helix-turn-helix domain-containing protein n=1 Tax=Mesorhizobium sp. KR1-2 TaxID=3156609 RepID=UPI0032B624C7
MNMGTDTRPMLALQAARRLARDLEKRRNVMGLTRFVLSQRLRVPVDLLERWENGRSFPNAPDLFAWAKELAFGIVLADADDRT